jgi:O-antigen/teichoic acid export membrane protein
MTSRPGGLRHFLTRDSSISRILRNAGWMLAGKGVGAVLSLFYLAAATRSLGPKGFGEFALILSLGQAVSGIMSFQTWRLVIRYGGRHVLAGDRPAFSRIVALCAGIDIAAAIIGCLLATLGVWLLAPSFGWTPALATSALLFAFVTLLSFRSTAVGVLRVQDRFREGAMADAAQPVTRLVGALVVLAIGPTVPLFLAAWALSEVTTAIAYWYLVVRRRSVVIDRDALRGALSVPRENRGFWGFTGLTNLGSTASSAQQQLPLLTVGLFAGPVAAGLFRFANQLSQALARVGDLLARSMFTEMSRVHAGEDPNAASALFRRSSRMAAIGGVSVLLIVVILGKPALYIISGSAYLPAYPLLVMLGAAAAIDLAAVGFEPALVAAGYAGRAVVIRLIALAVLGGTLWALLPVMQERGAGIAIIASSFASLILFGAAAYRATAAR